MNFIDHFFEDLDGYLEQKINTISCDEIADIYFRFITKIESYFANNRDFTGLTEFIIFRALYHLYSREINKGNLELIANDSIGRRRPDITVKYKKGLCSVISIKSNMDTGYSRIKKDFNKTKEIFEKYPYIKTLTISFDNRVTPGQKTLMNTYCNTNQFYNFVLLRNEKMKFKDMAYMRIFSVK